jgi:DNA-binding transcriptional ArsR family regulator
VAVEKKSLRSPKLVDPRIAKALAHPLRVRILATLSHRAISPVEFSRETRVPLSDAAYHFRKLEEFECAEITREVPVRGSTQHFYRGTTRPLLGDDAWKYLPASIRGGISGMIWQTLIERAAEAMEGGTFDSRDDRHFTWTPYTVDEQGWSELTALQAETLDAATAIEVRSAERMAESRENGINTTFALACFESPQLDQKKKRKS